MIIDYIYDHAKFKFKGHINLRCRVPPIFRDQIVVLLNSRASFFPNLKFNLKKSELISLSRPYASYVLFSITYIL